MLGDFLREELTEAKEAPKASVSEFLRERERERFNGEKRINWLLGEGEPLS